jgi:Zn-dependent M32 family carboxypeptidase
MSSGPHDPRDIPILTESTGKSAEAPPSFDFNAAHAAILTETLKLADSLLRQAARDIEATLFERVFDRLRNALPELLDRALSEHGSPEIPKEKSPETHD